MTAGVAAPPVVSPEGTEQAAKRRRRVPYLLLLPGLAYLFVLYVVPLLVESGGYRERVDRVLVVDCPEEIQVERVRARSGLSDEEAQAIVRAQAPRAARLAAADDVIDNSGTLDELRRQVAVLHARYAEMAKTARS